MAVQHRGADGDSCDAPVLHEEEGKEQMPKGILARLKSELAGISNHEFIIAAEEGVMIDII